MSDSPSPEARAGAEGQPGPSFGARAARIGATGLVLIALIAAHIYVDAKGPATIAPIQVVDHLFEIALALGFVALCTALGRAALRRLQIEFADPLGTLAFASAVGAALVSLVLLSAGLLGLVSGAAVTLLVLGLGVIVWREAIRLPGLLKAGLEEIRTRTDDRLLAGFALLVCGLVTIFLFLHATAPPTDWDSLMYHLEIPRQFIERGRIFVPEDNLHVAYVGLPHMWNLLFVALGAPSGPAIVSAVIALIFGLAVFSAAARFLDDATGLVSAALLWGTPTVLLVTITARVDVTVAFYAFLAHYALLLVAYRSGSMRHLYLAGAVLGLAAGVKLHAAAYGIGLAPLVVLAAYRASPDTRRAARALALFGFFVLLGAAPWLIKNWILLDAPLYPFLAEARLPPWLATIYGSWQLPAAVDPEVLGAVSQARSPFRLVDLFFAPGRLTVEGEGSFYHANPILLVLVLWPLWLKKGRLNWLGLPAVIYLLLIILPFRYTNLRYLLPGLIPLTIVAAHIVVTLGRRYLSRGAASLLIVGLATLALIPTGRTVYHWMTQREVVRYALGKIDVQDYLGRGFAYYRSLTNVVNSSVPDTGKVLLLFEARGYYFEPDVIQDNLLTNWPLLSEAPIEDCLDSVGVTHVMASTLAVRYYALRGMDPGLLKLEKFPDFAARCLETVYRGGGFVLYRVRDGSAAPHAEAEGEPEIQPGEHDEKQSS